MDLLPGHYRDRRYHQGLAIREYDPGEVVGSWDGGQCRPNILLDEEVIAAAIEYPSDNASTRSVVQPS
jgi:hypothetical protein